MGAFFALFPEGPESTPQKSREEAFFLRYRRIQGKSTEFGS